MKGRIAAAGVTGLVLVAMSAAPGAPAASAACPNEAFRTGPSAALAECRAYEMVSPVDKESGTGAFESGGAKVSPSGDGIYFHAPSAFAGAKGNVIFNPYLGTRADNSWTTVGISGPQAAQYQVAAATTFAVSDDLSKAFMASKEALAPGAIPDGSNLYVRDNQTGTYTTVAALPGNEAFAEWAANTQSFNPFGGADPGFEHILVVSRRVLAPGGVEIEEGLPPNLYEFSNGQLRLIAAEAERAAPPTASENIPNVVSTDGSRIYFNKVRFGGPLYLYRSGQETPELVSEDAEGNQLDGNLIAASPDGEVALFRTFSGVYRFEASAPAGKRVTRLTPSEGIGGELPLVRDAWTGEDLSSVYLVASSRLTPDAAPIGEDQFGNPFGIDLYVVHQEPGQKPLLRYLGNSKAPSSAENFVGFRTVSVSPDSRYFGFESYGQLTPDAIDGTAEDCAPFENEGTNIPGRCSNVFVYSYDSNRLTCVTCSGTPPVGESRIGGREARLENVTAPPAMLDDGMILFDTPNALLPRDTNGVRDAYTWQGGVTQLVSTGTDAAASEMLAASADGSNIFFITGQPLVGQDDDTFADLYDARIDGGLPQDGPQPSRPCSSESNCRSGTTTAAPTAQPGTAATMGGSQARPRNCSALRGRALKAKKHSHALARRAKAATGRRAKALRRAAARQAKASRRFGRRAGHCAGGGR